MVLNSLTSSHIPLELFHRRFKKFPIQEINFLFREPPSFLNRNNFLYRKFVSYLGTISDWQILLWEGQFRFTKNSNSNSKQYILCHDFTKKCFLQCLVLVIPSKQSLCSKPALSQRKHRSDFSRDFIAECVRSIGAAVENSFLNGITLCAAAGYSKLKS